MTVALFPRGYCGKGISEFLAQVPSAEPPEWDKLPEGYQREK